MKFPRKSMIKLIFNNSVPINEFYSEGDTIFM